MKVKQVIAIMLLFSFSVLANDINCSNTSNSIESKYEDLASISNKLSSEISIKLKYPKVNYKARFVTLKQSEITLKFCNYLKNINKKYFKKCSRKQIDTLDMLIKLDSIAEQGDMRASNAIEAWTQLSLPLIERGSIIWKKLSREGAVFHFEEDHKKTELSLEWDGNKVFLPISPRAVAGDKVDSSYILNLIH